MNEVIETKCILPKYANIYRETQFCFINFSFVNVELLKVELQWSKWSKLSIENVELENQYKR